MMRRLIIESIVYWMEEFHVDGFRFDLAELIDLDTLMAVRDAARAVNPDVILISEPWSFRGSHKYQLKGTGWSAWNDVFRDSVKHFITGNGDKERMRVSIAGSTETWTDSPLQSINYLESHDDYAMVDELSLRSDKDGRQLTPRGRRDCAFGGDDSVYLFGRTDGDGGAGVFAEQARGPEHV